MANHIKKSSLYLPEQLHKELKVMAARMDLTLNQLLEIIVKHWLNTANGKVEASQDKVE
jgi:predicted HicB family RNase H-like nuclease